MTCKNALPNKAWSCSDRQQAGKRDSPFTLLPFTVHSSIWMLSKEHSTKVKLNCGSSRSAHCQQLLFSLYENYSARRQFISQMVKISTTVVCHLVLLLVVWRIFWGWMWYTSVYWEEQWETGVCSHTAALGWPKHSPLAEGERCVL